LELFLVALLWVLITEGEDIATAVTASECHIRKFDIFHVADWFGDVQHCIVNYFSSVGSVIVRVASTFLLFPLSRICGLPNFITIFAIVLLNLTLVQNEVTGPTYARRPWQLWTIVCQLILLIYTNRLRKIWKSHRTPLSSSQRDGTQLVGSAVAIARRTTHSGWNLHIPSH
jgi:hypothetical protein